MSSALKNARRYKAINSFIHINRITFWAETYFSGSGSRMQLENSYASKEWQIESFINQSNREVPVAPRRAQP